MDYTTRRTCRICDSSRLVYLFSLGDLFVSDFVAVETIHKGIKAPIDLVLCEVCSLVQLCHTVNRDLLYKNYWYRSGTTDTMRKALRDITKLAEEVVDLSAGDAVLDIGSNDGTLLRTYATPGIIRIGFEPAKNIAGEEASQVGVDRTINDYWDADLYPIPVKPKVITALGMLYDLEDPNKFIEGIKKTLHPNGVFIAQLMCLRQTFDQADVGNFAHEHLLYFSIASLEYLLSQHSLEVLSIRANDVNGGSYRFVIRHRSHPNRVSMEYANRWMQEAKDGLHKPDAYEKLFRRMIDNRDRVVDFIRSERDKGLRTWVYGASTKGNTILQWYGLNAGDIDGASDRSPAKFGKYTIGTGIPIYSEELARESNPDYFLVLPYAFINEFVKRERNWLDHGGEFIQPLPVPKVIGSDGDTEHDWECLI